ncbi:hypothetical protein CK203_102563 [Vitis vinifera]|uniref:DUF4218 domain-containing protein n=1 Tax=Vitis vinifera TaxID=29760 RepID=A0A438D0Y8_VITVI|nr:hypothetical protein CK203_102563 [Vitis vinifera]
MGIRDQLHPIQRGNRVILPAACYSLTSNEKKEFCKFLKEVKVPDGYASNISRCVQVNERKIFGLKSHDCHVLMQQLLPLAIRGVLHKNVCAVIVELCSFFKQLCSKVLKTDQLEHLENDIIVTLCKLERIFPPSFFDVMVHLPIHLASEAKVVDQCNIDGCILSSGDTSLMGSDFTQENEKNGKKKLKTVELLVTIEVSSFASARDKNPTPSHVSYYGVLTDVLSYITLVEIESFYSSVTGGMKCHIEEERVQIVSPEDELDNLQQLLDIQPAATTTPSSSDPSDSSDPSAVDEKRLCHRPPHLSDDDWRWLIHFWGTPEAKVKIMIFS